jgi:hypothetical protein
MAQHTAMRPEFLERAGETAEGWEFIAPFTDAGGVSGEPGVPGAADFVTAHRKRFGAAPAAWSAEAYDVTGLVAQEVAALVGSATKGGAGPTGSPTATPSGGTPSAGTPSADGRPGRAALVAAIAASRYEGISRTYAFDEERQQLVGQDAHLYRAEGGRYRYLGPAPKPKS